MIQRELLGTETRDLSLSQWYTPPALAERVVEWADAAGAQSILEPAAGRGALLEPLPRGRDVVAVELDLENARSLRARYHEARIIQGDFLTARVDELGGRFDLAIMNPPYEHGLDAAFVYRASCHARRVVAILRSVFFHGTRRWETVLRYVDLVGLVYLVNRPQFGAPGMVSTGARSDFVVAEFRHRSMPLELGEDDCRPTVEWWTI